MQNQEEGQGGKKRWCGDAPVVERPLLKVLCIVCGGINDEDFRYCKHCGMPAGQNVQKENQGQGRVLGTQQFIHNIPEEAIGLRLKQFKEERVTDSYHKRGNAEFEKFEIFLYSRGMEADRKWERSRLGQNSQPSVLKATPKDVLAYLAMKDVDNSGRTFVHNQQCIRLGIQDTGKDRRLQPCSSDKCALRHGGESMRTGIVQMLINGYDAIGVKEQWDPENNTGNPATAKEIGQYIKFSKKEQLQAGVTTKQAAVMLRREMETLVARMRPLLLLAIFRKHFQEELIIRLCMATFVTAFSSTKRGESLCNILIPKIMRIPAPKGDISPLVLNLTWGKTLRDGGIDTFGLEPYMPNKWACPVSLIEEYVECAIAQGYDMKGGYLFGNFDPVTKIKSKLKPAQMTAWLKKYLKQVGLNDDDQGLLNRSMHSFRAGGAICRILEGESLEKVMQQAYWKCPQTALHYLKIMEVLCPTGSHSSRVSPQEYKRMNEMPMQECTRMCQAFIK